MRRTPGRQPLSAQPCPCGSGRARSECCGPLVEGRVQAGTAEQLMRSRYTAYVLQDTDHLRRTWAVATCPEPLVLDPGRRWTGLEVLSARGGLFDARGEVHFRASWQQGGRRGVLEERSAFGREQGRWVYLAALPLTATGGA